MNKFEYKNLTPFKWFVLENFPFIEADFDALTEWQLFCKVGKEMNKIINSQNIVGEQVETLTNAFNTLYNTLTQDYQDLVDFVNNSFSELNVQDEINNKLNAMVEDGTMAEIINQEIFTELNNKIGNLATLNTTNKTNLVNAINEVNNNIDPKIYLNKLDIIRNKYNINDEKFIIPNEFDNFIKNNLSIFYNKFNKYRAYIDINLFKNTGGTTYYISPNGNNANDGLTPENPKKNFMSAYNACSDGDTIVLLNGFYKRENFQTDTFILSKHINIIGEEQDKVIIKGCDNYIWESDTTYTNIYKTTRSAVVDVNFSLNYKDFINLEKKETIEEVSNTKWSWAILSGVVYINTDNIVPNDTNIFLSLAYNNPFFTFDDFTGDGKIYFENITLLNADKGGISINNNTSFNTYVGIKNCKIYNIKSSNYSKDNFSNVGCFSYCENVICNNGGKDGFNYHSGTNKNAIGIEYNCSANKFGIGRTLSNQLSNNASTCHETSEVIRINGIYGNCNGSVLADVNNSKSLNLNCISIDSLGLTADKSTQIIATNNSIIYAYNCFFYGLGLYSMYGANDGIIYYKNTIFQNKIGNCIEITA